MKDCSIGGNGVAKRIVRVAKCGIGVGNGQIGVEMFSHSCRFILFAEINFGFRCVFCGNVVSLLVELQCGTGGLCFCFGCCE